MRSLSLALSARENSPQDEPFISLPPFGREGGDWEVSASLGISGVLPG